MQIELKLKAILNLVSNIEWKKDSRNLILKTYMISLLELDRNIEQHSKIKQIEIFWVKLIQTKEKEWENSVILVFSKKRRHINMEYNKQNRIMDLKLV